MEHIANREEDLKCCPEQVPHTEQNSNDEKISSGDIARILARLRNTPTEELSVAERLTLRAVDRQFTVTLDSERGPVAVVCRVPTPAEYQDLIEMQKSVLQVGATALQGAAVCTVLAKGDQGDSTDNMQTLKEMRAALHESKMCLAETQRRLSEILAAVTTDPSLTVNFFNAGILTHEDTSLIVRGLLQHGHPHPLRARMPPNPSCEGKNEA